MAQIQAPNNIRYAPGGAQPGGPRSPGAPPRSARLIPDLRPGESVVLLQRHHPGVLLRKLLGPCLLLVLWVVSLAFLSPMVAGVQSDPVGPIPGEMAAWLPSALW